MSGKRGWSWDAHNGTLEAYVDGTEALTLNDASPYVTVPNGLTVTAGGATVTAGGLTVTAGGVLCKAGRLTEVLTTTNNDAQHNTLSAAEILGGLVVHTSVTGGGTVTMDTAANIVAGVPLTENGQAVACYYINDGDQTLTLANDAGNTCTVADTGQTIAENEAALLLFVRTSATAVVVYCIGA